MRTSVSFLCARSGIAWIGGLLALSMAMVLSAQSPVTDPPVIEKTWQKADSKYDGVRAKILKQVDEQVERGPFRADWESLAKYREPQWYQDAKFGIFIHWGVYSVPAFGSEWYPRNMYQEGSPEYEHHIATYGPQNKFGYKDFIPMFKAEHFDPAAWARLFREAGAKYVVPVAEHHDGFPMYESSLTDWCAGKMGPKRDILGDLAQAIRAEGLHFGASSHRAEHDWFFDGGRAFNSDVNDAKYADFYGPAHVRRLRPGYDNDLIEDWTYVSPEYADDWLARTAEIVEKYHPDLIYFDWWIGQPSFRRNISRFAAFYYNQGADRGTGAVIDYKDHAFQENSATLDIERGQLTDIRPTHWQTDTSVSDKSWGYVPNDTYKTPEFIVHQLVDIVSKNGNLLLNIGPRSDGTIPEEEQQILREVGAWLKVNGEAIYGTRPWKIYGEGPTKVAGGAFHDIDTKSYTEEDFRFTRKGTTLYAIGLVWPAGGVAHIHSLGTDTSGGGAKIQSVTLLGSEGRIEWQQQADALTVKLPVQAPSKYGYALRIQMP
ncbi:MAG: alpha-L-fucosidase [Candidatus Sulfotelmatobacter sp.]